MENLIWIIYILCVSYCIYKMYKNYTKYDNPGAIGTTPGLETLFIIIFAPVLAVVDITLTWVRKYREYREEDKIL